VSVIIIYNTETTNIQNTLDEFNQIHPKLKFTLELETNNKINFLDITINKQINKLTYNIYRKPTTTDTIIHNTSCHPTEHKIAAINYLKNRKETYQLTPANKIQEENTIKQILHNNGYKQQIKNKTHTHNITKTNTKPHWTTFTYFGSDTRIITKLFRNANLKIAYKTTNPLNTT
jgi:hypothetical protein